MGVSGSGKTTVGRLLATHLNCPFYDADDFHPPENVAKMASGIPLNDQDRDPWLGRLHELIQQHLEAGESAVLACSALKESYRDRLREGHNHVQFIHLNGNFDLIWQRMTKRKNHYMQPEMLQSQFNVLEPPDSQEAITIKINKPIEEIVQEIIMSIKK